MNRTYTKSEISKTRNKATRYTKKEVLRMSDSMIDKTVKVQGTKFDRKLTFTQAEIQEMIYQYKCGKSAYQIAEEMGRRVDAVKYHVDPVWRAHRNSTKNSKHYGKDSVTTAERASYKRRLVMANAKVIYPKAF